MEKSRSKKTGSEPHPISLRLVIPAVPQDEVEKLMLVEDLTQIGYEGLFIHPWSLKIEEMVREFSREHSNEWEDILRKDPEKWTAKLWVEVYNFPKEGRGWAS